MRKSVTASIFVIAAVLICLLGLSGCEGKNVDDRNEPGGIGIDSGDISSNTGLEVSKALNKSNGEYVNFYVENNGSNPVVATINGQNGRTFKVGEKGYVYSEVTQGFLGLDKEYMFKAVPGTNGGSISIHYEISQDLYCYPEDTGR